MSTSEGRVRNLAMAHRYGFLRAIHKLVPEVLADLERDVLPAFRAMFGNHPRQELGERGAPVLNESGVSIEMLWISWPSSREALEKKQDWYGPSWAGDIRGAQLDSVGRNFVDAMEKWAATYNLSSEAILEDAFTTIHVWLQNPHRKRAWEPLGALWTRDEVRNLPKLTIEDTWSFETWPTVEKRLMKQLAAYKADVKRYAALIGFDLDRMRPDRSHHQWLALFQCKGMSPEKIKAWHQNYNGQTVDPTTISHAVETLARRIGLERRPAMRGRRRAR